MALQARFQTDPRPPTAVALFRVAPPHLPDRVAAGQDERYSSRAAPPNPVAITSPVRLRSLSNWCACSESGQEGQQRQISQAAAKSARPQTASGLLGCGWAWCVQLADVSYGSMRRKRFFWQVS